MKKASKKWGLFYYWCGWGCIIVGISALIYSFLTLYGFLSWESSQSNAAGFMIGRGVVVLLMGGYWLRKGKREIAEARIEELKKELSPEG